MFRKPRWLVIIGLVLAQVGIIVCYQGFLRGSSDSPHCPGCCVANKPQAAEPTPPVRITQLPPPTDVVIPPVTPHDDGIFIGPAAVANQAMPPHLAAAPVDVSQAPEPPIPTPVPMAPPPPAFESPPAPPVAVQTEPPLAPQTPFPVPSVSPPPVADSAPPSPPPPSDPLVPVAPPARLNAPEPSPAPGVPARAPIPPPAPTQPPQLPPVGPCPWTLKMTIVDGLTVVEARIGKEIQFRISCARLDLQSPRGSILAQGDVKISGSGLDGQCERLLINWSDDRLVVEGNAYMKCLRDGHDVELNAERMSLRLSESSTIKGVGKVKLPQAEEMSEPHEPAKNVLKPPMPIRAE